MLIEMIIAWAHPNDLYTLTRVSSHFFASSAKRIWKVLPSMLPLLRLLPPIAFQSLQPHKVSYISES